MGDAGQHPGIGETGLEHGALIDKISEPVSAPLPMDLEPRPPPPPAPPNRPPPPHPPRPTHPPPCRRAPAPPPRGAKPLAQPPPHRLHLLTGQPRGPRRLPLPVEPFCG